MYYTDKEFKEILPMCDNDNGIYFKENVQNSRTFPPHTSVRLSRGAGVPHLPPGDLLRGIQRNLALLNGQYLTQDDLETLKDIEFEIGVISRELR